MLVHSLSLLGKQYDLGTSSRAPKLCSVLAQPALAYSSQKPGVYNSRDELAMPTLLKMK